MVLERSLNPHGDRYLRVPFYLTSSYREKLGIKGVSLKTNPSAVSFRSPKRTTRRDTRGGATFFHWTNTLGRNNDLLEMDFQGQTGNINIKAGTHLKGVTGVAGAVSDGVDWLNDALSDLNGANTDTPIAVEAMGKHIDSSGAAKLVNFHNLASLTREPMVDPRTGGPIAYYIWYSSPIFGNSYITLVGHFNRGLEFTDNATDPNNLKYSFGFTVQSSFPSMDYLYTTILRNISNQFMNLGAW